MFVRLYFLSPMISLILLLSLFVLKLYSSSESGYDYYNKVRGRKSEREREREREREGKCQGKREGK